MVDLVGVNADQDDLVGAAAPSKLDDGLKASDPDPFEDQEVVHGVNTRATRQSRDLNAIKTVLEVQDDILTPAACTVHEGIAAGVALQTVVTAFSGQPVVGIASPQEVVARPTSEIVYVETAIEAIVASAT